MGRAPPPPAATAAPAPPAGDAPGAASLPSTAQLLASGGDLRIVPDPATGLSMYGCALQPDPGLVQLGSSTASVISPAGMAAADALRAELLDELRHAPLDAVYARHAARLRADLLALCGASGSSAEAILAASGTDLHLLAAQWLRPALSVMTAPEETGSGLPPALRGRHFNSRAAGGPAVPRDTPIGPWEGGLAALTLRHPDGSLRAQADVDRDCTGMVDAAAGAGRRVLLILTDCSKTGLIAPSVATALALKSRWPAQVEVLVDACQFRLSTATVRAYLERDCLVALTGSKFMSGPTFCGVLLAPPGVAARHRDKALPAGARSYSTRADWPDWHAAANLPATANPGLLLRWQAALAEIRAFTNVPAPFVRHFLQCFGEAVCRRLRKQACFELLAAPALERNGLPQNDDSWDREPGIFSFLLCAPASPLGKEDTLRLYRALRSADGGPRFMLGQPVACGERDGIALSALRICASAAMITSAYRHGDNEGRAAIGDAMAALDRLAILIGDRDW
jgi:hypothetical protein